MRYAMRENDPDSFEKNFKDAQGYQHTAEHFSEVGMRHSVVFNVASVAMERYLVAICAFHKSMPEDHNFRGLVDAVEVLTPFPETLAEGIRALDEIFGICSLDEYHHGEPTPSDAVRLLDLCRSIRRFIDEMVTMSQSSSPTSVPSYPG